MCGVASLLVTGNASEWGPFAGGQTVPTILESVFTGLGIGARDLTER